MMNDDSVLFFLFLIALITIIGIIVVILKKSADNFLGDNEDSLIDYHSKAYRSCCDYGQKLLNGRERFDAIISEYSLNETVQCSSSVVSGAEKNNAKYILKYSKLTYSAECIRDLDCCYQYVNYITGFKVNSDLLIEMMKAKIPRYLFVFIGKENLRYIIAEKCKLDFSAFCIDVPRFEFLYRSPQGRSMKRCIIELSPWFTNELKNIIQEGLNRDNYSKRQRRAMTKDLRDAIKIRDNYTCCKCGNSIYKEPNLLLEIDHIIPISKGGKTEPNNLQTLCWKCNRSKSDKSVFV